MGTDKAASSASQQQWWILYLTLLVAGLVLLCDEFRVQHLHRWTAQLGVALVYSAFVLYAGKGRPLAFTSAALICLVVVATWLW